jgi:hypothetical protein
VANNVLLASDNFASGSVAPGWNAAFGLSVCQVVSHQAEANALSVQAAQFWTGIAFPVDQISEFTVGSGWVNESGTVISLIVRATGNTSGTKTCYQADLTFNATGPSAAALYVVTNGTAVQQGATITGLTVATGDVWVFQAAGSVVVLYQNNNFIGYFADASIKNGSPGFMCYSSINVAHAPIASWRGYNAKQQDGVWQKQGIAVAPNATDLASFGAQNPTILLDTNPQLLGSSPVWKMWFWAGTNNLGYAESAQNDGINWTRRSPDVIAAGNVVDPIVLKIANTYHLYGVNLGASPTAVYHFTSADGISWSAGTQVLTGTAAAWDAYLIFFTPFYITSGGTWHAIYTGYTSSAAATPGQLGHATSPDGITWTKDAANPVQSNFIGLQSLLQIGGVWYGWGAAVNPGRGSSAPGDTPGSGLRMQTTDFVHWTNPVHTMHFGQIFEGLNGVVGGNYPVGVILVINNQSYLYRTASVNDISGSHNQISLAIAPVPPSSLILFNEDGVKQTSSDNFTSGLGNLSGNWSTPVGLTKLQIVAGNLVEGTATAVSCGMVYTGAGFANDQYSEVTVGALPASTNYIAAMVRAQLGAFNCYQFIVQGPTGSLVAGASIQKKISGVTTQVGPLASLTLQIGDVLRMVAQGSNPVLLSAYQNGYLILQVEDWASTYLSGSPGMLCFANTTLTQSQISLWAGGNAGVMPPYPPSGGSGDLGPGYDFKFRL